MSYPHRLVIVVPAEHLATADALAAGVDFDTGGGRTFSGGVQLSASGLEPATHYATSTVATDATRNAILALASTHPWAAVFDCTALGWADDASTANALASLGLVPVRLPEVP